MNRENWCEAVLVVLLLVAFTVPLPVFAAGLPSQQLVLVIDNSGSMKDNDPLRLRGVAASLVLDAADLVSRLQAGIVFFNSNVEADTHFEEPSKVKFRLQSDKLPQEDGGTNMQAALESALSLLRSSTAQEKKILLLTDGAPDQGQEGPIRASIVSQIKASGIKLYALGLSRNVNKAFLDEITGATGGIAVVAESHKDLLRNAKQLLGKKDNIFTLEDKQLQDNETEYAFEIPEGVDRARLTVILENAQLFGPGQIEFEIQGPGSVDSQAAPYSIKKDNETRIVAWSAFLSGPPKGEYTLRTAVDKPPFTGHQGATVLLEARTDFNVEILLNPEQEEYYFADEVALDVFPYKATGPVDPGLVTVSGRIELQDGSAAPISMNGINGSFTVPESEGRHTIYIEASTSPKFPPVVATKTYRAIRQDPADLRSERTRIVFQHELGPEHLEVEESFKIHADFPEGKYRQVKVSALLTAPHISDLVTLRTKDGQMLKLNGKKAITIRPKAGLDLILSIAYGSELSFDRPLNLTEPKYQGTLIIASRDASGDLEIPFEVRVRIPSLDLLHPTESFALWWSPDAAYPRTVTLGNVTTDANQASEFRVVVPSEDILISDGPADAIQRKIATWHVLETEETRALGEKSGEVLYGPYALSRSKYPLQSMVTPDAGENGTKFVKGAQTFSYELQSRFGVRHNYEVEVITLPPPWWAPPYLSDLIAPISAYGQHALIWLCAIALFLFVRPLRRLNTLRKYGSWRKGKIKKFAPGNLHIGGGGVLELPNLKNSPRTKICRFEQYNENVMVEGAKYIQVNKERLDNGPRILKRNDVISILDPKNSRKPFWKMRYWKFDNRTQKIVVRIQESPIRDTFAKIVTGIIVAVLLFIVAKHVLEGAWTAEMAYKIPLIDVLYSMLF